jgi:hypothetical protein
MVSVLENSFSGRSGDSAMTIPFEVWIDGIVGTASFLADHAKVERAWTGADSSFTSITSFDEAYEQLFDDLAATEYLEEYSGRAELSEGQRKTLREFVTVVERADKRPFVSNGQLDVRALLASAAWREVEMAARNIVLSFGRR